MTEPLDQDLTALVRDVPDFPEPGVMFKDITPLLADAKAFARVVEAIADCGRRPDGAPTVDVVAGIEARGFILAAPVALALGAGFVPVRKRGKLPAETFVQSYTLEYGTAEVEVHRDAFRPGARVLIVDDVLATGGTMAATARLVQEAGAELAGAAVLMELSFLQGRRAVASLELTALTVV